MNLALRDLVDRHGGLVSRRLACQVAPEWALEQACHAGRLLRVLPEVYVDPRLLLRPLRNEELPLIALLSPEVAHRAALAWADGRAVLSHVSALQCWGLLPPATGARFATCPARTLTTPLHLSAPMAAGIRSRAGVVVHRYHDLVLGPPWVLVRSGLPVTRLERTLVDSWPLLGPADRRAPVIRAVNERLTTPDRLAAALALAPRLTGRAELRTLLARLAEGCRSPLEIWGHERVFTGPGMPTFRRQARIRVGRRTMYLDLFAERERVAVELDGATVHGDPRQREIDLRSDALLATVGVLTVRFAHRRLVHEPDEVRRETLAILASRR